MIQGSLASTIVIDGMYVSCLCAAQGCPNIFEPLECRVLHAGSKYPRGFRKEGGSSSTSTVPCFESRQYGESGRPKRGVHCAISGSFSKFQEDGDLAFALPVLVAAGVSGSTSRTRLLWSTIVRLPLPQERPRWDRVHDQPPATIGATSALLIVCADRKEVPF